MVGFRFFFLGAFLCARLFASVHFSIEDLQTWVREDPLRLLPSEREAARSFRYVFIKGYLNEVIPGYMDDSREALESFGVPLDQVHVISPPSFRSIQVESRHLGRQLAGIVERGPQPLVLIGHSKGASSVLAFALQNPEFVRVHVKAIFPLQGVFGGSGVADNLYFWTTASRRGLSKEGYSDPAALLFSAFAFLARPVVSAGACFGAFQGMRSLTHLHNQKYWESLRESCEQSIPLVASKTLFLRTAQHPKHQEGALRLTSAFLRHTYGVSDGMVGVDEQYLPWMQQNCPVFLQNADHHGLTHQSPLTTASSTLRKRFIAALLKGLARPAQRL